MNTDPAGLALIASLSLAIAVFAGGTVVWLAFAFLDQWQHARRLARENADLRDDIGQYAQAYTYVCGELEYALHGSAVPDHVPAEWEDQR